MQFQPPSGTTQYPPSQPLPPQSPAMQPAPRPPKKHLKKRWIALAAIVLIVIISVIANGSHGSSPGASVTPTAQPTQATTQAATTATTQAQPTSQPTQKPTTPAPTFITFGDGIFQVGKDIQPGTYRTRQGSTNCYYARLKSFDTQAIISNNNTDAPAIITIQATDKAFQSQSCGTWTSDLSQITSSKTSFGDGIYIVGTDIAPGNYKNTASTNCYYARLSAFDTQAIISNNNTDAVAIVTIAASDKGFQTSNCGTWTKI